MSVLCYDGDTEYLTCALCGNGWDESDLYRCDECQRVMCCECYVPAADDAPRATA